MDRAFGFGPKGWGFKSLRAYSYLYLRPIYFTKIIFITLVKFLLGFATSVASSR